MPVEFLSDDQAATFGRFSGVPSRRELEQSAWFDDADRAVIAGHRGDGNRLGFATQLATVRMVGGFLVDPLDVPWVVVTFVAGQLGVADPSVVKAYAAREKTLYEHQWEIAERFGFRPWGEPAVQAELRPFLSARAWTSVEGPSRLYTRYLDAALTQLERGGTEPAAEDEVQRLSRRCQMGCVNGSLP